MAKLTVEVPDGAEERIADAFAGLYGYDGAPGNQAAKRSFVITKLADYVTDVVRSYEAEQARAAAEEAVQGGAAFSLR